MLDIKIPAVASALLMLGCVAGNELPEEASTNDGKADLLEESCNLSDTESTIQETLDVAGLTQTNALFADLEVLAQGNEFANSVWFDEALSLAIDSFLYDGSDVESPRALMEFVDTDPACTAGASLNDSLASRVHCHMNQSETVLALVEREFDKDAAIRIFPPEQRDDISQNWVFFLKVPSMGDHLQWAVVSRQRNSDDTVTVTNYGFS